MPVVNNTFAATVNWTGTAVSGDGAHSNTDPSTVDTGGTRTLGMDLSDCTGFRVIVSAASSQTLSGAGTVRIWMWSTLLTRWVHNSQLDYTLSFTSGTWRDDVSPDFQCTVGYGAVYPQLVNVTSSSGNVTPQAEGGVLNP